MLGVAALIRRMAAIAHGAALLWNPGPRSTVRRLELPQLWTVGRRSYNRLGRRHNLRSVDERAAESGMMQPCSRQAGRGAVGQSFTPSHKGFTCAKLQFAGYHPRGSNTLAGDSDKHTPNGFLQHFSSPRHRKQLTVAADRRTVIVRREKAIWQGDKPASVEDVIKLAAAAMGLVERTRPRGPAASISSASTTTA